MLLQNVVLMLQFFSTLIQRGWLPERSEYCNVTDEMISLCVCYLELKCVDVCEGCSDAQIRAQFRLILSLINTALLNLIQTCPFEIKKSKMNKNCSFSLLICLFGVRSGSLPVTSGLGQFLSSFHLCILLQIIVKKWKNNIVILLCVQQA